AALRQLAGALLEGATGCSTNKSAYLWRRVLRAIEGKVAPPGPAAAQRLYELNGGRQALAGELRIGALGLEGIAARVHDLEVADDAGAITLGSQVRGAMGAGDCAILRRSLVR